MIKPLKIVLLGLILSIGTCFADNITVSAIQLEAKQQSLSQLKADITTYAQKAKEQGANIVVFPEDVWMNTIYDKPWAKSSLLDLVNDYLEIKKFVGELSQKLETIIIAGTTTYVNDGRLYNVALIGLTNGETIEHDKIYLTPGEIDVGYDGSSNDILVLDTKEGRIAIIICYSSEFTDVSQELYKINPDIVIVPSYSDDIYGMQRLHTAIKMLSIQNYSYGVLVGMVSNKDEDNLNGADGVAQALFTSPQQQGFPIGQLAKAKFNHQDMLTQTLDIEKLHQLKQAYTAFPNKDTELANKEIKYNTVNTVLK